MDAQEHEIVNLPELIEVIEAFGKRLTNAIRPMGVAPGHDATGGTVDSLTEAVMGITGGLVRIADAMNNVADAIRDSRPE